MTSLRLRVRTPSELVLDVAVSAIQAEDVSGWFGILPGREDVVAVLPPGLLVFRDAEREGFVALAGGLLNLESSDCRVTTPDAVVSYDLEEVAERVAKHLAARQSRKRSQTDAIEDLAREALRRVVDRGIS